VPRGCAFALLLAVTNHILRNVAAIPLLWVGPLSLYLLSLIICFENPRWYLSAALVWAFRGGFRLAAVFARKRTFSGGLFGAAAALLGAFLVCCMVCHGELAGLKPDPSALTSFYLSVAAGGAIGGLGDRRHRDPWFSTATTIWR
jgi:hypothetical protein